MKGNGVDSVDCVEAGPRGGSVPGLHGTWNAPRDRPLLGASRGQAGSVSGVSRGGAREDKADQDRSWDRGHGWTTEAKCEGQNWAEVATLPGGWWELGDASGSGVVRFGRPKVHAGRHSERAGRGRPGPHTDLQGDGGGIPEGNGGDCGRGGSRVLSPRGLQATWV